MKLSCYSFAGIELIFFFSYEVNKSTVPQGAWMNLERETSY